MKYFLSSLVCGIGFSAVAASAAFAQSPVAACELTNSGTLQIEFHGFKPAAAEIPPLVDGLRNHVLDLAKKNGIDSVVVISYNYNIGQNNRNGDSDGNSPPMFNYNGSAQFSIKPIDKAAQLIDTLKQEKVSSTLIVNSHLVGACQNLVY